MLCPLKSRDLYQNHDNAFHQKELNWTLNLVQSSAGMFRGNSGSTTQSSSHVMDSIVSVQRNSLSQSCNSASNELRNDHHQQNICSLACTIYQNSCFLYILIISTIISTIRQIITSGIS
jgi:hypothetical protein